MTIIPALTESTVKRQLRRLLHNKLDDTLVSECVHICLMYNMPAQDLYDHWEAMAVNQGLTDKDLTLARIEDLKSLIQAHVSIKPAALAKPAALRNTPPSRVFDSHRVVHSTESISQLMAELSQPSQQLPSALSDVTLNSSPLKPGFSKSDFSDPTPGAKFAQRTDKGRVEVSFNSHLTHFGHDNTGTDTDTRAGKDRFALIDNQNLTPFNYMYDKINDLGLALDEYLDVFEQKFRSVFPNIDSFSNPSYPTQNPIFVIGRIVAQDTDGRAHTKLEPDYLVLECGRKYTGVRIKLVLSNSIGFHSLFPGQIVVVEGINPEGNVLFVDKILHLPLPDPPTSLASDLLASSRNPTTMLIASGPFSTTDSLDYEPFNTLVSDIQARKPHLVVLIGPFVPETHPIIQDGKLHAFPEDVFQSRIVQPLMPVLEHSTVVVIPSLNDLHHPFCLIPQPPFVSKNIPDGLLMLSNPVQFSWHEWVIAVASTDVLMDVSVCEWSTTNVPSQLGTGSGRDVLCARHLLEQRTFHPVQPPPLSSRIDLSRASQIELQVSPDILIIPSKMRAAVKVIPHSKDQKSTTDLLSLDDPVTLLINPGHATKGMLGGTVAWVTAYPFDSEILHKLVGQESDAADEVVYHAPQCRIKAEIVRL